ncbi:MULTISPECIES: hypothetical protein [Edwardsiella]|uniref:hypothetical protein n=1 Tax=Edwardsiella TaxID=635 RepID=UPI0005EFAC26|nr:hypothetical protein [Edwardsiella anguillarum]AKM47955.1 hypothetical protein QY76_12015 [Edwardsiella sp. EA181011]RFT03759.1 hypothetical protein CGL57_08390 [Edwardsiella anguillarum]
MIIEKNLVALECDLIDDVSRAESTARDRHNIWFWNTTSAFLYRWIGQSSQLRQRRKPKHHHGARGNAFSHDVTPRQVIEARRR